MTAIDMGSFFFGKMLRYLFHNISGLKLLDSNMEH